MPIDRRDLLKALGATVLAAPGLSMLEAVVVDEAAVAHAAGLTNHGPALEAPQLRLGAAAVRPPSIPLAVSSPYLSTWLPATELTAASAQFWNGSARDFVGLIRIDGKPFTWAGQPSFDSGLPVPEMRQVAVTVTATSSIFTFKAGGVQLVVQWTSPIEPGDLRLQSIPFSLLHVSFSSTDRRHHSVQLYADITGEWAVTEPTDLIEWEHSSTAGEESWQIRLQNEQPVTELDDMAQWGDVVWSTTKTASLSHQGAYSAITRSTFAQIGRLLNTTDTSFRAANEGQPTFAFAREFGSTYGGSIDFAIGHVRNPLVSYGAETVPLRPLWTTHWSSWQSMLSFVLNDSANARARANRLDLEIEAAATRAGGSDYAAICALALRQCYGGTELVVGPAGSPWMMAKEISSGGGTNTVDIFDRAFLAWLWLDPERIPLLMEPILDWSASPAWQNPSAWAGIESFEDFQTKYCLHHLGYYPVVSGAIPGVGEQMPIEESAGMLIMAAGYARKVGARVAKPFLAKWAPLWTQWAQYLETQVPTPANQLSTDDWAPIYHTTTGSVNLGLKAMIGLAAAGQISAILGNENDAATWTAAASEHVDSWVELSMDPSGQHLNLAQGLANTWSTLYNAFYEQVIGVQLVPDAIAAKQRAFYATRLTEYGMPLQTAAQNVAKVEWLIYLAAWFDDDELRDQLLRRSARFIDETPTLVPYGDRYDTTTAVAAPGIMAHPTLGAVYALLVAEDLRPSI